ncbi:MAG TPA: MFS transporter, partial [Terriglobales bacterium]|nr:MFS transporter [Terriglobales bacterium]
WGPRRPMLLGCAITGAGILLTTFTFLLAKDYVIAAFVGFTLFGIGLGFYATPSTDAAVSNVPDDKVGSASGIYKMASSLGAAIGVAISAAIFTDLSGRPGLSPMADIALGRTDNLNIRFAAAIALLFNVAMVSWPCSRFPRRCPKQDREKPRRCSAGSPASEMRFNDLFWKMTNRK